jgi:drug/metabolite transporter (DMT)-like permease
VHDQARGEVRTPRIAAVLALSLATASWGASYVVAKDLLHRYDPLSILAVRFCLGTAVLLLLRPRSVAQLPAASRRHAAIIGVVLGAAQIPHYFGVQESSASVAAFLIGTYVVMTPVVDWVLHRARVSRTTLAGTLLALVGLALFAGGGSVSLLGLVLCLTAALLYAVQISTVGAWVPATNLWGFTAVTMAAITVVVAVPALVRGVELPVSPGDWLGILYLCLFAGIAGVALQSWGQRHIAPTQAAVILVMEPVWATALAVVFLDDHLDAQLLLGGAVLLVANVVVARGSRRRRAEGPLVGGS